MLRYLPAQSSCSHSLSHDGLTHVLYVSLQFASLQREIDNRNLDIEKLKMEQQKLHGVIKALEKDIMGLKREIQERDETIQDKVELKISLSLLIRAEYEGEGVVYSSVFL